MLAKSLMVLGKLSLILACSVSHADPSWEGPKYKDWQRNDGILGFAYNVNRYFATKLSKEDASVHSRTVYFALNNLETGEVAEWFNDRTVSQGRARIIATWTAGGDICRRVYSYVINGQKSFTYEDTACYNNNIKTWNFIDKY